MENHLAIRARNSGFSMGEVIIALFIVGLSVVLVAGLGRQIAQFGNKANQTGAVLEIRSMASSITRDSDSWLSLMRSSSHTQGIFAGCIPDPKVNVSTFSCPSEESSILSNDSHLATLAGSVFHVVSAPIVSNTGDKIAGTESDPAYLSIDGTPCNLENKNQCHFKSVGYFFRSNSSTNQDPGSVKFVLKVTKNLTGPDSGGVMKPQYMSIDIGDSWKKTAPETCPLGTIKLGYSSNGNAFCIKPSGGCNAIEEVAVGVDAQGNTLCEKFPECQNISDSIVLSSTKKLVCSNTPNECGPGKVFLGYFAGNGEPICTGLSMKCGSNQIQVGITQLNGNISAECVAMPTTSCTEANSRLTYNGQAFVCQSDTAAIQCPSNKVMTGINSEGQPICADRTIASDTRTCAPTASGTPQYVKGVRDDNTLECAPLTFTNSECPAGQTMYGINSDGTLKCRSSTSCFSKQNYSLLSPITLSAGNYLISAVAAIKPKGNNADYAITLNLTLNNNTIAKFSWASPGDIDGGSNKIVNGTQVKHVSLTTNGTLSFTHDPTNYSNGTTKGYNVEYFDLEVYKLDCN